MRKNYAKFNFLHFLSLNYDSNSKAIIKYTQLKLLNLITILILIDFIFYN